MSDVNRFDLAEAYRMVEADLRKRKVVEIAFVVPTGEEEERYDSSGRVALTREDGDDLVQLSDESNLYLAVQRIPM